MSEEITTIERSQQTTLCISEKVGTMKLGSIMGPAYKEIYEHIKQQETSPNPANVPFTIYKNIDWEKASKKGLWSMIYLLFFHKWDVEIGIPCSESTKGKGRIQEIKIESGKYFRILHKGSYKKVGESYEKILEFSKKQNLNCKNYSIEFYLNDPTTTAENDLMTEVLVPLSL